MRAFFLITAVLLLCHAGFAQETSGGAPTGIEEAYLAKDDGEGRAGSHATEFRTTDIPIYCVVLLESDATTTVKMIFVAVNVSGVKPETKVVTATYITRAGQNRVNFTGRPDGKWTPGKYRVDLFLDGNKVKNLEFDIKSSGVNINAARNLQPTANQKPRPVRRPGKN